MHLTPRTGCAAIGLSGSPWFAPLFAPVLALATWFAFLIWREAGAAP